MTLLPEKQLRKYAKEAVAMWAKFDQEHYPGISGLEDAVEHCVPYEKYTGGYNEVYLAASASIRRLVRAGLVAKKGAKP